MTTRFPFAQWDEQRYPLPDEMADAERRARYWEWSAVGMFEDVGTTPVMDAGSTGRWVEIVDSRGADFEAFHLQHSIGYNWHHYSSMGRLLSLRGGDDGIPRITVLVANGTIVHARGLENQALDPDQLRTLSLMASHEGLEMLPPDEL